MPWPLQEGISHALAILSWYEAYTGDELPPENLWDDAEAVEEHFSRVRDRKRAEFAGPGSDDYDLDVESDNVMGNELASVFKQ